MPRTIAHRELRNNSSAVLRDVQAGETVYVTNNGEVVAVLVPPPRAAGASLRIRQATVAICAASTAYPYSPHSRHAAVRLRMAVSDRLRIADRLRMARLAARSARRRT
jgi:prevent-host-death family protein